MITFRSLVSSRLAIYKVNVTSVGKKKTSMLYLDDDFAVVLL